MIELKLMMIIMIAIIEIIEIIEIIKLELIVDNILNKCEGEGM